MTGYMHPDYAQSLVEFGTPRLLPRSGGWVLERQIPETPYKDAMGCYPRFVCKNWSQLYQDLDDIRDELVSISLVTDTFGDYDVNILQKCFNKVVIPFKEHYIVDLRCPFNEFVSRHHRYYMRKALKNVYVEECREPTQFLNDWEELYDNLIKRNGVKGIRAFSRAAFARQLSVPGITVFRAVHEGATVGAQLWYVQGEVAYSHLTAMSPVGYDLRASYAIYGFAINKFANGVMRWLDLGSGAGVKGDNSDGLNVFKRGWSTGTRPVYFCGSILNEARYARIVKAGSMGACEYFPAYRKGEFV